MTMGRLDLSNFYDFLILFECHRDLSCKVLQYILSIKQSLWTCIISISVWSLLVTTSRKSYIFFLLEKVRLIMIRFKWQSQLTLPRNVRLALVRWFLLWPLAVCSAMLQVLAVLRCWSRCCWSGTRERGDLIPKQRMEGWNLFVRESRESLMFYNGILGGVWFCCFRKGDIF